MDLDYREVRQDLVVRPDRFLLFDLVAHVHLLPPQALQVPEGLADREDRYRPLGLGIQMLLLDLRVPEDLAVREDRKNHKSEYILAWSKKRLCCRNYFPQ